MSSVITSNGPTKVDENTFVEQSLEDVLHSVPDMNESPQAVHSGSPPLMSPFSGNVDPQPFRAVSPSQQSRPVTTPGTLPMMNQKPGQIPPATTTIPLTSPSPTSNGEESQSRLTKPSQSKIDYFKQWSISTYKCTRQILSEKLGKGSRTVDLELEAQIELLRDTQRKYLHILRMARALTSQFYQMVQTQQSLSEAFSDLAHKSPELQEEFLYNAETQKNLSKNGEKLLGALNFFVSSLNTLCNKTIEDTLLTVKHFENARLEYDAYRTDLEELMQASQGDSMSSRVDEAQRNFSVHKEKYERLRSDVAVKMKFLDENKVKVMHKQLLLFHNAISGYFSGNQVMLETTLKQFNIKMKNPNATSPSWLEQ